MCANPRLLPLRRTSGQQKPQKPLTRPNCALWGRQGSNLRRLSRRFYRPLPLATRLKTASVSVACGPAPQRSRSAINRWAKASVSRHWRRRRARRSSSLPSALSAASAFLSEPSLGARPRLSGELCLVKPAAGPRRGHDDPGLQPAPSAGGRGGRLCALDQKPPRPRPEAKPDGLRGGPRRLANTASSLSAGSSRLAVSVAARSTLAAIAPEPR
jgi:hypothetical protein